MDALVYRHEQLLGRILLVLGSLIWVALMVATLGGALVWILIGLLVYLFAQSAFISHIKGNGIELSDTQLPELHLQFAECCRKLDIRKPPKIYLLNGGGWMNALATRFLGREYVVLLSDIVDAMDKHPDGVRFYIGHELGHLRLKHLSFAHRLRWPALWIPLLGAAYSRAMESSCDLHGRACCRTPESSVRALAALAAGANRWATLDLPTYRRQSKQEPGFWMSFHELINGYPWLVKRAARVLEPDRTLPRRHPLAYLLAAFVPYIGRAGAGAGVLILAMIAGVLAAVALPAYSDYIARAEIAHAINGSKSVRYQLAAYYRANGTVPKSLQALGVPDTLPQGQTLMLDPSDMSLTIGTKGGDLIYVPQTHASGSITWRCKAGDDMKAALLPKQCQAAER